MNAHNRWQYLQRRSVGGTHHAHAARDRVQRHHHLHLGACGVDRAGAHDLLTQLARAVEGLEHHIGAGVQRTAQQGDGLTRVGGSRARIGGGAAVGRGGQPAQRDAEGRTGAAHGADPDRSGGCACGHHHIDAAVVVVNIEPVVARDVADLLRAQPHAAGTLGKAAAAEHQGAADEGAPAHARIAQRGHDLQQQAAGVALQAHPPGGGVGGHHGAQGLVDRVHRGRHRELGQVARIVQRGEDQPVGGLQAAAADRDALAGVGCGQRGLRGGAAGGRGTQTAQVAQARSEALQAQAVSTKVAGRVARVGDLGVVAGVAVAADTEVEGAPGRSRPVLRGVAAAGAEVRRQQQLHAVGIKDARVGVQAGRVAQVEAELVARVQVESVQVHILVVGAGQTGADLDALVQPERRVQRGAQRVAHVGGRVQLGQGGDGDSTAAQRAAAPGGGHRDQACAHTARHGEGEQLLVGRACAAVHDGAHAEAAHAAAVDGDGQVVGGQSTAFDHHRVACCHHAASNAHGAQGGHDLQGHADPAAQHTHPPGAGQRGHGDAQALAVGAGTAGAGERAHRAAVINALELHQGGVAQALAQQHDGLSGHSRGHAGVGRDAAGRRRSDAAEHAGGLRRKVDASQLGVAAFGADADGAVQRARGHHVEGVVARTGHVKRGQVGGAIGQHHPADGDAGGAFHEARALQVEQAVLARAARVGARQRGHHLQPHASAGTEGLRRVHVRVVGQCLVQLAHAVHADVDQVGPAARTVAVPAVEHQQIKTQGVGLPGVQSAQVQALAGVVEAPAEAAEGGHGVAVDRAVAPGGVGGAGLEVVREHGHRAAAHHHVVEAPALVIQGLQPTVAEVDHRGAGPSGKAQGDVAVDRVGIAAEAQVAGALVDHPHVPGAGQVRHLHLQPRARVVDDQRGLRDDPGVALVVPDVEQHPRARPKIAAHQFDHLAHIGRRQPRIGRHARAGAGVDLAERGRQHGHRVHRRLDAVELALCGGDPQGAVRGEGQARDLVLVEVLAARVQAAQLRQHPAGPDLVLHQLRPPVGRAQPQVAGGGVHRQPRVRLDVERRRDHPNLRPGHRAQLDEAVARPVVLGQVNVPVGRVERRPRQVVVGVQRQPRDHRPGRRVHRQHLVRVGVAVEDQQTARRHVGAAKRHRRPEHLQAQVVEGVRCAKVARQRDRLQHLPAGRVDLEQVPRVGLVAHPQLATGRVHRHVAQAGARHVHPHGVERKRRAAAPCGAHRDVAQPVRGQRRAVQVGAAVLLHAVVVDVDVVRVRRRVGDAGPCEGVGRAALHIARAQQHRAVLDVNAADGGHDLQQRLAGRPKHLQAVRAVHIERQHQRGAAPVGGRRARAQAHHLQQPVDVAVAQQHVRARAQPRAHQRDGLPRVGRALRRIGRRARQRRAVHPAQVDAVARTRPACGLDVDRPEHPVAQRHRHPGVAVVDVHPQRRVVAVQHVRARVRARVQHRARSEPVLGVTPLHQPRPRDQHLRAAPVRRHRLHLNAHNRWQYLQREGAVSKVCTHRADLRKHHDVSGERVHRHVEIGVATRRVNAEDVDRGRADSPVGIHDFEGSAGVGRVEGHCNADLLARIGRWCRRGGWGATERAHIAGRADGEVAHDVRAQHIAHPVVDHGLVDAQLVVAGRQITVGHHREFLAKSASVDCEGGGYVVGGAEDAVSTGAHQRHQGRGEPRRVDRLVKHHIERAHQEAPFAFSNAGGHHHRCEGVGHDLQCDEVGQAHIAPRVGGAHLHSDGPATR